MFELIYTVDGMVRKHYPQTETKARRLIAEIMDNAPVYGLVSCEKCNNYEAYKAGSDQYIEFLLEQNGAVNLDQVSEEQEQAAIDAVLDAPFEYDADLAYFLLCEHRSFREANEYYREVTA